MKFLYRCLATSIAILLVVQLACDDNVTGFMIDPTENWYGQLTVDAVHSILKSDRTVWAWGYNGFGTLGNGTTESSELPVRALNLNNVISIDQSYGAEVAVDKSGNIWFWGNLWIYLGTPDTDTNVVAPFKIAQLTGVRIITMTGVFIFLLKNDHTVWYIKMDFYSPTIVEGPTIIEDIPDIVSICEYFAVTSEGLIYDVLSNNYVQENSINIRTVSGNPGRHVLALNKDGTVWAWGNNDLGQLGNGTFANSELPTRVLNLTDITAISANYDFNLALKNDGTVWFWGFEGREGDSLLAQNVPVKIEQISDAALICSGYDGLIMTKDGTYWNFNVNDKITSIVLFNGQ